MANLMDNRIRQLEVHDRSLIPAEAELWITVTAECHTPTTEIRGRLMGPRCPYASTVEVAYPLRPLPPHRTSPQSIGATMRVVIPEASLWEPESPFLYQGPIELWQDGQRRDQIKLSHGLRSFLLGERGLRVNGRPLTLRGRTVSACSDEDALALRQAGCNLLVVPVEADTLAVWERADRLGFFVLGQLRENCEQTLRHLEILSRHTSCLGWLIEEGVGIPFHSLPQHGLVGLICDSPPQRLYLSVVHFLVGPLALANLGMPLLVTGEEPVPSPDAPGILGSIV
ncbi:MAG TPA: hypothetical protein VN688_26620 [Gemmataceae bacterium]|nr:hypothetical protein [Gemmataceae bacterium]